MSWVAWPSVDLGQHLAHEVANDCRFFLDVVTPFDEMVARVVGPRLARRLFSLLGLLERLEAVVIIPSAIRFGLRRCQRLEMNHRVVALDRCLKADIKLATELGHSSWRICRSVQHSSVKHDHARPARFCGLCVVFQ